MKATNLGYILNTLDEEIDAEYTDPRRTASTAAAATTKPAVSVDSHLPSRLAQRSLDRLNDNRSSSPTGTFSSLALTRVDSHIPAHARRPQRTGSGRWLCPPKPYCFSGERHIPGRAVTLRQLRQVEDSRPGAGASFDCHTATANITGDGGASSNDNEKEVQEPVTRGAQCMMESSVAHLRRMRNREAAKKSREQKHKQLVDMGKELTCSKLRVTEMSHQLELLREKYQSLLGIIQPALRKNVERNGLPDFAVLSLLQSAAAQKPQPSSYFEPWLTEILRRIETNEPLDSVSEHQMCLGKALSSPKAIWLLASLMRKTPKSEVDRGFYYQLVDIEANIVLVDIPCNEVVFKLTLNTIETLIKYYHDVYRIDAEGKEHHQRLHDDFVQAIKRYDFCMRASVLEGLEKDGAGELLCGQSQNVKTRILEIMERLSPSPPKEVEPI
ncbi:uncharacterized protein PgNI_12526 [Pyricularia grisea]|uniref:BZIP domain-containing protein n=1 Tax=Pyricularia grisea TaxID=148305 RepID=A0A6P8AM85_PYRGI|nr:uncharacterized protein PgNI_12526 [Pyricularia grisea]TLD03144.1 hypothetical protein PgNI_12526 [Pyricularia grisea]